ncbi:MAG: hypothetical protein OXG81_16180 [Acidobacteria bacterium]|nr:hypothetical protein [Acidobacteriota bacterium]
MLRGRRASLAPSHLGAVPPVPVSATGFGPFLGDEWQLRRPFFPDARPCRLRQLVQLRHEQDTGGSR